MSRIQAIYRHGVFEPLQAVNLREDQRVELDIVEKPVAKLVQSSGPKAGSAKGKIKISDDFDEPLEDFVPYLK